MPTLDNFVAPSRLVQKRTTYTGTIPAAPAATGLLSISLPLEPSLAERRLYAAFIVDDVSAFTLTGTLGFRLGGNLKTEIPVRLGEQQIGWDGSSTSSRVTTLPLWGVERWNYEEARNVSLLPASVIPNALQAAFLYNDTATQWVYRVTMAPLRIVGAFDELSWSPETFYGTALSSQVFQATVLAVISDER